MVGMELLDVNVGSDSLLELRRPPWKAALLSIGAHCVVCVVCACKFVTVVCVVICMCACVCKFMFMEVEVEESGIMI